MHKFVDRITKSAENIDILCTGFWVPNIEDLVKWYSPNALLVSSSMMYPFWKELSWTNALVNRKVLVIHPFSKLIEKQYVRRDKLFHSQEILPKFELLTYQAIQSMGGNGKFSSWFEALYKMQSDIEKIDFDIALIGCGAYGMPLGAFIKKYMHRQAIHLGGTLQILFGIKGKRWEKGNYRYDQKLYNDYWVRPTEDLKPENYIRVEDGCYW